ncbi:MAG: phosphate ABC transporter substrate-binding protein PstS family protein [Methanomicrobiales archaeon]|nr:phosphate ABC transporter substrate-binding protein PstS family protein [Methanomicrobiales archaeon]MDD1646417.1 phosphate ABC transporter substrate-binding protein PstS family protein [Methanomicrobiales archaeon]
MKTWYRSLPLILVGLLLIGIFASGCTGTPEQKPVPTTVATPVPTSMVPGQTGTPETAAPTPVSPAPPGVVSQIPGTIMVSGSTTVLPIAQAAAEAYMDRNAQADIQVAGGGSSVGVQAVGEMTSEIGMSSRDLKSEERTRYPGLVEHAVAKDAIVVIVHPDNPVSAMTLDQVRGIYNGSIQSWDAVGGSTSAFVVIGRDSASGTREYFTEHVMKKEKYRSDMREMNSNGAIATYVSGNRYAIGYVGLGYLSDDLKGVKIISEGTAVESSVATVLSGSYPISRSLYMITNGEPTGLTKDYLDFVLSAEGQAIVTREGFVPLV